MRTIRMQLDKVKVIDIDVVTDKLAMSLEMW